MLAPVVFRIQLPDDEGKLSEVGECICARTGVHEVTLELAAWVGGHIRLSTSRLESSTWTSAGWVESRYCEKR
jgi:hypothetical protein